LEKDLFLCGSVTNLAFKTTLRSAAEQMFGNIPGLNIGCNKVRLVHSIAIKMKS